ncbi:MAG: SAM-dependent methyltransferase [Streptosporangiales bacterium]|nr:SAM-dependent methyltransferase [Streptosporangiales bacterium]
MQPYVDTTVASVARGYGYMLGDEENCYEVDRIAAHGIEEMVPGTFALARNNRRFLVRSTRFLAKECGIRQFIDNGSGLPTQMNIHQVAKEVAPDARVVYIDHDPVVLAHQRDKALLADDGTTAFICEDACNVDAILNHPETRRLINFDEPVAVAYYSFLHCIPDAADPLGVVRQMMDNVVGGSYLVLSHLISPDAEVRQRITDFLVNATGGNWGRVREEEDVRAFFEGLELVEPGLGHVTDWRPDGGEEEQTHEWIEYGGVARKP